MIISMYDYNSTILHTKIMKNKEIYIKNLFD